MRGKTWGGLKNGRECHDTLVHYGMYDYKAASLSRTIGSQLDVPHECVETQRLTAFTVVCYFKQRVYY